MVCEKGYEDLSKLIIHHGAAVNYQDKVHHNVTMHC